MSLHNAEDLAMGTGRDPQTEPPSGTILAGVAAAHNETAARRAVLLTSIKARKEGLTVYALAQKHGWAYGYVRSLVFDLAERGLVHADGDRWVEGPGEQPFSRPLQLQPAASAAPPQAESAADKPPPLPPRSPVARWQGTTPESLLEGKRVRDARGNRAQHEVALAVVRALGGDGNASSVANLLGRIERGLDVGASRYLPVIYEVLGLHAPGGPELPPVAREVPAGLAAREAEGGETQAPSLGGESQTALDAPSTEEEGDDGPVQDPGLGGSGEAATADRGEAGEAQGGAGADAADHEQSAAPSSGEGEEEGQGPGLTESRSERAERLLSALHEAQLWIAESQADNEVAATFDDIAAFLGVPEWVEATDVYDALKQRENELLDRVQLHRQEAERLRAELLQLRQGLRQLAGEP